MKNKHNLSNLLFRFQAGIIILLLFIYSPFNLAAQNLAVADTQTIEDLFEYVENNSDYSVFYQNDQVNIKQKVSFKQGKGNIDNILGKTLPQCGLTYKYVDNHIVITPHKATKNSPQQEFIIKGKVSDETGESLIGVNIIIEGTTTGTVTDFDGNYTLEVSDPNITLVFSYIGYLPVSIPVNGQSEINVVLQMDAVGIDEVVVIGYGSQKKSDITGAISSIKIDDITKISVPDITQAMQGLAAGVDVTQITGAPGEGVKVQIRGAGSVTGESSPLYIVDGVPTKDAMNNLSTFDIKSISVLKDAAS
ncbi:MAG: carboxypeptidase-like regulatory domain-containing protein, partial [Bacteroidales bacterium]|nr:carboxypeptidase-like regulatory domain-containing protein [Bacteroidales bacterium]